MALTCILRPMTTVLIGSLAFPALGTCGRLEAGQIGQVAGGCMLCCAIKFRISQADHDGAFILQMPAACWRGALHLSTPTNLDSVSGSAALWWPSCQISSKPHTALLPLIHIIMVMDLELSIILVGDRIFRHHCQSLS